MNKKINDIISNQNITIDDATKLFTILENYNFENISFYNNNGKIFLLMEV